MTDFCTSSKAAGTAILSAKKYRIKKDNVFGLNLSLFSLQFILKNDSDQMILCEFIPITILSVLLISLDEIICHFET